MDIRLAQARVTTTRPGRPANGPSGRRIRCPRVSAAAARHQTGLPEQRTPLAVRQIDDLGLRLEALRGAAEMRPPHRSVDVVLDPWLAERAEWAPGIAPTRLRRRGGGLPCGRTEEAGRLLGEATSWLAGLEAVVWLDLDPGAEPLGTRDRRGAGAGEISAGPDLTAAFLVELARRRMSVDPEEETASRLRRAQEFIGDRPMYWHGLLWETRAEVAAADDQPDEEYRESAISVWLELGQLARAEQMGLSLSAEPVPMGLPAEFEPGPGRGSSSWSPAAFPSATTGRAPCQAGPGGTAAAGTEDPAGRGPEPVDVRFSGDSSAPPWELLGWDGKQLGRHPKVRCVYRTPPSLAVGRGITLWVSRGVQIVHPEPAVAARMRGVPGSLKPADVYRNRDVLVETRVPGDMFGDVAVVHIAGVTDTAQGVPAISFLGDDDRIEPDAPAPATSAVAARPALVVLDIIAPVNRAEFRAPARTA